MSILEVIGLCALVMWLMGQGFHVGGNFVNVLLAVVVVVVAVRVIQGRRI